MIAGGNMLFHKQKGFGAAKSGGVLYLIVNHPAARGITNAYFENVGECWTFCPD